jgi:hypothetical protein
LTPKVKTIGYEQATISHFCGKSATVVGQVQTSVSRSSYLAARVTPTPDEEPQRQQAIEKLKEKLDSQKQS